MLNLQNINWSNSFLCAVVAIVVGIIGASIGNGVSAEEAAPNASYFVGAVFAALSWLATAAALYRPVHR